MKTLEEKKSFLKTLSTGDILETSDGKEVEFIKVNRTKFICIVSDETYNYPIEMFVKLIKKGEPNPQLKKAKEIVKKYKGSSLGTVYGPSTIVGLSIDQKTVELLEHGEEHYSLSIENFLSQYEEYGICS